ncbi:MAG TPA: acetyl-CoA carboxylase biotin carboxyl carrier protein subunit [Pyrinomonadaceae bacterium]|jgi:biotin carboxyl carrier protein
MKLQAEIDGQIHRVEIRRDGDRTFAGVDDREYALEISQPEPGVYLFKHEGHIYQAFVAPPQERNSAFAVDIRGKRFSVAISDPRRLRGMRSEHGHDQGLAEIRSAMPGKVVRILAVAGQQVEKGDGVIVVEAMKMQNEIKASKDGAVKSVNVEEGATVNAGDVLMVVE